MERAPKIVQLKTPRYWGWWNSIILINCLGHQEDLLWQPVEVTISIYPIVQGWAASWLQSGRWTTAPGWLICRVFPKPVHWSSVSRCRTDVISPQVSWYDWLARIWAALLTWFPHCNWSFGATSDSKSGECSLKLKGSRLKCDERKYFLLGARGNQWNSLPRNDVFWELERETHW